MICEFNLCSQLIKFQSH